MDIRLFSGECLQFSALKVHSALQRYQQRIERKERKRLVALMKAREKERGKKKRRGRFGGSDDDDDDGEEDGTGGKGKHGRGRRRGRTRTSSSVNGTSRRRGGSANRRGNGRGASFADDDSDSDASRGSSAYDDMYSGDESEEDMTMMTEREEWLEGQEDRVGGGGTSGKEDDDGQLTKLASSRLSRLTSSSRGTRPKSSHPLTSRGVSTSMSSAPGPSSGWKKYPSHPLIAPPRQLDRQTSVLLRRAVYSAMMGAVPKPLVRVLKSKLTKVSGVNHKYAYTLRHPYTSDIHINVCCHALFPSHACSADWAHLCPSLSSHALEPLHCEQFAALRGELRLFTPGTELFSRQEFMPCECIDQHAR